MAEQGLRYATVFLPHAKTRPMAKVATTGEPAMSEQD